MSNENQSANESIEIECDVCRVVAECGIEKWATACGNESCPAKGKFILRPLPKTDKQIRFICLCGGTEQYACTDRDLSHVFCTCGRKLTILDTVVEIRNNELIYGVDHKLSILAEVDGIREELKKATEVIEELCEKAEEFGEESDREKERLEEANNQLKAELTKLEQRKEEQAREITQLRKSLDFAPKNEKTAEGKLATLSAEIVTLKKQNMEHELKNKVLEKMLDKKNAKRGSSLFGCFRRSRPNDN